jgi:hypothetical protein
MQAEVSLVCINGCEGAGAEASSGFTLSNMPLTSHFERLNKVWSSPFERLNGLSTSNFGGKAFDLFFCEEEDAFNLSFWGSEYSLLLLLFGVDYSLQPLYLVGSPLGIPPLSFEG